MFLNKSEFYLQYTDVLNADAHNNLLNATISFEDKFTDPSSKAQMFALKPGLTYRKSRLLYEEDIPEYKAMFKDILLPLVPFFCSYFNLTPFESNNIEIKLTMHNDGDYFLWHNDNGNQEASSRSVTFVYYYYFEPKMFSGGELVMYPAGTKPVAISPLNNSMIIFNPSVMHEVKPVICPEKLYPQSRFALTGWILNKAIPRNREVYL